MYFPLFKWPHTLHSYDSIAPPDPPFLFPTSITWTSIDTHGRLFWFMSDDHRKDYLYSSLLVASLSSNTYQLILLSIPCPAQISSQSVFMGKAHIMHVPRWWPEIWKKIVPNDLPKYFSIIMIILRAEFEASERNGVGSQDGKIWKPQRISLRPFPYFHQSYMSLVVIVCEAKKRTEAIWLAYFLAPAVSNRIFPSFPSPFKPP